MMNGTILRATPLLSFVAVSLVLLSHAYAFRSVAPRSARIRTTSLPAIQPEFLDGVLGGSDGVLDAADYARQRFWFYFFAGSGAGGIGIAQLPNLFREADVARATAGSGATRGGAALNAGPLVGIYYASDISSRDVADAIAKAPTADFISRRSQSEGYAARKGYIVQSDFLREMEAKKCNPLASCVLFNAISTGKGGIVSPVVYEEKLLAYREGATAGDVAKSFVGDLNSFLAVKAIAFVGLVFCLLVDFGLVAKNGIEGFL